MADNIFITEDDDNIREMMAYALHGAGYDITELSCSADLFSALGCEIPNLILLDIMLPGEDGISILKKLKESDKYCSIPVIMLTAKGTELDKVRGLDLGADDYITKPFSVMEAISRVKAVLRRSYREKRAQDCFCVGFIALFPEKRMVLVQDRPVDLTFKEFELLYYLMKNEGIVLSRSRLLDSVWGFDYGGESRTVDMHIKSLRKKLGDGAAAVKTVRNIGYKIE